MSRTKKSRKGGGSAKPRSEHEKKLSKGGSGEQKGKQKGKGLASGSRHSGQAVKNSGSRGGKQNKDPRHGSKKKVSLTPPVVTAAKPVAFSPAATPLTPELELAQLEQDPKLMQLLELVDNEKPLNAADQAWLDKKMERHYQLLELLDLLDDDEENDDEFEQGDLDKFLDD